MERTRAGVWVTATVLVSAGTDDRMGVRPLGRERSWPSCTADSPWRSVGLLPAPRLRRQRRKGRRDATHHRLMGHGHCNPHGFAGSRELAVAQRRALLRHRAARGRRRRVRQHALHRSRARRLRGCGRCPLVRRRRPAVAAHGVVDDDAELVGSYTYARIRDLNATGFFEMQKVFVASIGRRRRQCLGQDRADGAQHQLRGPARIVVERYAKRSAAKPVIDGVALPIAWQRLKRASDGRRRAPVRIRVKWPRDGSVRTSTEAGRGTMRANRSRLSLVAVIALAVGAAWFARTAVRGQTAPQAWRTTFASTAQPIRAAGDYRGVPVTRSCTLKASAC